MINLPGGLFTVILRAVNFAAQEKDFLIGSEVLRSQLGTHAVFTHHGAGNQGGPLDIVVGAGGNIAENQFLCRTTAHERYQIGLKSFLRLGISILFRQGHGGPESTTAGNDGDLVDRFAFRRVVHGDSMTGLVIGGQLLFFDIQDMTAALASPHDLVSRFFHIHLLDILRSAARCQQGGFIDEVGQIGTGKTGRTTCRKLEIDFVGESDIAGVNPEDLFAAFESREVYNHLPVKPAGPQQGRVEHIGPVGGRNNDNTFLSIKAIHLHEQGVERLLTFIMSAADAAETAAADRVDFINEDDARGIFLSLLKHIAHAGGPDAYEHFNKIRAADGKEGNVGLSGDGLGQQRLACTGLSGQQNTLRHLAAQFLKLLRILQELDHLGQLLLGFVDTGNRFECDLVLVLGQQFCPALSEAHGPAAGVLHLPDKDKIDDAENENKRDYIGEEGEQHGFRALHPHLYAVFLQDFHQLLCQDDLRAETRGSGFIDVLGLTGDIVVAGTIMSNVHL